eukprot:XP_011613128.1 PREDICTED: HAUS augmin-like complex subunit 8 isoform X1 [Takifugu rubripes]
MASRRTTLGPNTFKNVTTDAKSAKGSTADNTASTRTTTGKKVVKSGTIVKSRYMQAAEKSSLSKSNSLTNESIAVPPKPSSPKPSGIRSKVSTPPKPKFGTPPKRSLAPHALGASTLPHETELSMIGKSVLQSTFSDGHCFGPDFDISVIKDKIDHEHVAEPERNPENDKKLIEMQTFLLAYLTAKMESNTAKLKAEAEARILQEMEEEHALHNEVQEKKRQYLLMEKERTINEMLDLQVAVLTPVADAAKEFTKEYISFATAVDTTRHELPVKNFYIDGDRREFLDKAETCLKESEKLLLECTEGAHEDNSTSLECLRDIKIMSKNISQELSGTFSELLELSSLVCRHTVHLQQSIEEEQLGLARIQELYCNKR